MQAEPRYDDRGGGGRSFLEERLAFAVGARDPRGRVCLDPGIGLGKTVASDLELVRAVSIGSARAREPVLVASRGRAPCAG